MLNAIPMVISKESFEQIFTFAEDNSALAKNLYNAALFRIRQVFTGWNKTKRTDLEQLVFDELKQTETVYKSFKPRHVLSYAALDKIMRATSNPDFFAGLPMQTAQQVLKDAVHDFKTFVLCSRDESGTASRTKPFIGNSWRYFSELCSVLDTTFIGAMHCIGVETSLQRGT